MLHTFAASGEIRALSGRFQYNPSSTAPINGECLRISMEITAAERQELYASPERVAWILRTYDPELERGRPILYFPDDLRTGRMSAAAVD